MTLQNYQILVKSQFDLTENLICYCYTERNSCGQNHATFREVNQLTSGTLGSNEVDRVLLSTRLSPGPEEVDAKVVEVEVIEVEVVEGRVVVLVEVDVVSILEDVVLGGPTGRVVTWRGDNVVATGVVGAASSEPFGGGST